MNRKKIEYTFKSKDTEEFLDVLFYRPFGYVMALAAKKMGITPNQVTIFSIFVGVLAGHLFFYNNLYINIIGILLLIWAEALDSTDGQLARITDHRSRFGRILDGFAGNLWFLSIYIHLTLRYILLGGSPWIIFFVIFAAMSHSFQSAIADYYRNFYLFFVLGNNKSEIDKSENIYQEYKQLSWSKNFFKKFLLNIYLTYTKEQELFSYKLRKLFQYTLDNYNGEMPQSFKDEYRRLSKPLIKYYNILTTNTRMIVLFISLFLNSFEIYLAFEITILNFLFIYVVNKQEKISDIMLNYAKIRPQLSYSP